jgi:DNA-binding transcriptional MocR family regulator
MLLNPGDEVVVEIPTYLGAIQAFRALGAKIIGIPTDNEGMRVDLLETILARRNPRFIYTLPTFQNPTGVMLSSERRRRLLGLSRRYQIPIVEDDPYGEIYFGATEPAPLKAQDTRGHVLYLSTYSKILAPGLRVAWLAAPEQMIERLSLHKQVFDLNTNAIGQWIVAEMIKQDLLDAHLAIARQQYKQKRDLMLTAIHEYWPASIRVNQPEGGFHLWCRLPAHISARTLQREAAQEHVALVIGEPFHVDGGGRHAIRLSFAFPSTEHLQAGIQRLGKVIERMLERRTTHDEPYDQPPEHLPMV